MKNKALLFFAVFLLTLGCKNKKNLPTDGSLSGSINLNEFIGIVKSDTTIFKYMTSKAKLSVDNNGKTNTIKLFVKSTSDSALMANVSVISIPLARGLVTPDSLIVTQNRDKCYRRASSSDLQQLIPVAVDFGVLQDILHGSSFGYDSLQSYFLVDENGEPVLSTHAEKELKWLEKNKLDKLSETPQIIRYYLNDSLKRVERIRINFPLDTGEVNIYYDERQEIDGMSAPLTTRLSSSNPRNTVHIKLEYGRVKLNEPHYLSLSIPDNYDPCP